MIFRSFSVRLGVAFRGWPAVERQRAPGIPLTRRWGLADARPAATRSLRTGHEESRSVRLDDPADRFELGPVCGSKPFEDD